MSNSSQEKLIPNDYRDFANINMNRQNQSIKETSFSSETKDVNKL